MRLLARSSCCYWTGKPSVAVTNSKFTHSPHRIRFSRILIKFRCSCSDPRSSATGNTTSVASNGLCPADQMVIFASFRRAKTARALRGAFHLHTSGNLLFIHVYSVRLRSQQRLLPVFCRYLNISSSISSSTALQVLCLHLNYIHSFKVELPHSR